MANLKYFPISRITTSKYTSGNLYELDGKPYVGAYYMTYRGEAYTGENPLVGGNELLVELGTSKGIKKSYNQSINNYNAATQNTQPPAQYQATNSKLPQTLKGIIPYYPIPSDADYARGYFMRYFAKRIADKGYIMEVSYGDYSIIKDATDPTYQDYEIESMMWQLTGPLKDTRVSQYQVKGGVETTNKRVTEQKAKNFVGLVEFIGGDYTKFAKITT
jgi:hypothetical protein